MAQRILIVDDERSIRLTLSQTIAGMGYETGTAETGDGALAMLQTAGWDLVLLDLRLPGLDGMEVLRRTMEGPLRPKVIIITAHGTVDNAVEALKLGAVDFIQKPFTPDEIRELVQRVMARDTLPSQTGDYTRALELAKREMVARRWETADEYLRQAIQLAPNRPAAFNLLGMLKELLGEHREALNNYRAALDFDPTYQPARANLERATQRRNTGPNLRDL